MATSSTGQFSSHATLTHSQYTSGSKLREHSTAMEGEKPAPVESSTADRPSGDVAEKKAPNAAESRCEEPPQGVSATAVLWTFGKCVGALLPVYLAGYYRVSTSLLVCGMVVYTGWKHAREAKEARLRSAIHFLGTEEELACRTVSGIKRELPAWVRETRERSVKFLLVCVVVYFVFKTKTVLASRVEWPHCLR